MPAPNISLSTTGTDPKSTTKQELETEVNAALEENYDNIEAHKAETENPHGVTKSQVGLGNVDNTADADKPVSTAQQAALDAKANTDDLADVATSGDSDDLTEGATHLLMTKPERDLIAQGGAVAPALDDWSQLVIDDAGQPVWGVKSDGSQWAAEGGRMVKKASGGLLSEGAPQIGDWLELHRDAAGKIVLGTKADGSIWAAQGGELVQITSGGRGDRIAPQIGEWAALTRDADGRPVAGTKADGSTWRAVDGEMVKVTSGGRALELAPQADDWVQLTQDASGAPVLGQRETGQIEQALGGVMVPLLAERGLGRLRPQSYAFDHNSGTHYLSAEQAATVDYLIMVVGQSLSEGSNTDASDGPVTTSPDHAGYALMPAGGVGRSRTDRYDAYEDLYEIREADTGTKETICSGMADAIMRRLNSELGFKPRMIFDVAGRGGVAYYGSQSGSSDTGLKIGSDPFDWALRRIESARDVSARAGRQLVVAGIVVVHGEQDTTEGTSTEEYKRALSNWERTLGDETMRLTGQAIRPRWYLTQTNRPAAAVGATVVAKIPRAQAEAPEINPQLCLVGATYFQEDCGDHSHPTAASYRRIGGMVGNAIASDLFGPYHVPLKIVDAWQVDATTIRAQFSMDIALETDDSRVTISTLGAGKGIHFDDRSGAPPTVTGISIVGGSGDTVELTLSGAPSGYHRRLLVANQATGTGPGAVTGPRSGIRSAASYDTDPLDGYAHYWWATTQVFDF